MGRKIKIAIAGNPNCGKTTLFNALTGANQYVGNWPGVTVEKKEGNLKSNKDVIITDLPGIYSLSPYTPEEVVARNYLINDKPDVILNIVDGTNLERNLYLTTQLVELGIPVVVAINMMDIVRKNGDKIDISTLSKELGVEIVEISALKNTGITEAIDTSLEIAKNGIKRIPIHRFCGCVEHAIAHIEEAILHDFPEEQQRWFAVKLFERDERVINKLQIKEHTMNHIIKDIEACELEMDDDAEAIITNERYEYITKVVSKCCKKTKKGIFSTSDKIDRIVTNRVLALPIFFLVMWAVYTISIGTVGNWTVTFMNDGLFGSFADTYQNGFLNRLLSVPELIDMLFIDENNKLIVAEWFYSLVQDGIIGGVGAVLGFVPQMLILFLLLSLLEDCGYMARVAFIMDKIFKKFGLSGKSFIPMLIASGCGVPGIMASRTIEQERDRKITIMTTGFIPCSAKMPVVGFIAGALFKGSGLIATASYFIGIMAVIVSGMILKKIKFFSKDPAPFVMELPSYHMPVISNVLRSTWDRGWGFIKRAGTLILASSIIIWFLSNVSFADGFGCDINNSILADIGSIFAIIFTPLGFSKWETAVATLMGLVAKEEIVAIFGTLSNISEDAMISGYAWGNMFFTGRLAGFSFLIFNLLCAPCIAAMGAIKREMNNMKWTVFAIGYMCSFAYTTSLIVYQLGLFITGGTFGLWTFVALVLLVGILYLMFRKVKYNKYNDSAVNVELSCGYDCSRCKMSKKL